MTGGEAPSEYPPLCATAPAGNGALIARRPRERRFGVEVDADHVEAGDYSALHGDLQRLYPLVRLAAVRLPGVVCNPPSGSTGRTPRPAAR